MTIPLRLNSFGRAIQRIEAERIEEAKQTIAQGAKPQPQKEDPKPCTAKQKVERLEGLAMKLEPREERRADFGEVNIPYTKRSAAVESQINRALAHQQVVRDLEYARSRMAYWAKKEAL